MMAPAQVAGRVVALTGATGFIGTALMSRLLAAGWHVRALYRPRPGRTLLRVGGTDWVAGDVSDVAALATLVEGAEAVVHCAGVVRGARRADFDRVNAEGARRVALAASHAPGCTRLLLLSSLAAREPGLSDYAGSKRRAEDAIKANAGEVRWTILRPPAVYGPGDREMLPLFRGIARGVAWLPGTVRGRFSLLHVADLASAIVDWLAGEVGAGATFELDDGREGGYDWNAVLAVAGPLLHGSGAVRQVRIPVPLLSTMAWCNLAAAMILGYAPMLTPGKVHELAHADWVCDGTPFSRCTGWHPVFDLARGLAHTFRVQNAVSQGVV